MPPFWFARLPSVTRRWPSGGGRGGGQSDYSDSVSQLVSEQCRVRSLRARTAHTSNMKFQLPTSNERTDSLHTHTLPMHGLLQVTAALFAPPPRLLRGPTRDTRDSGHSLALLTRLCHLPAHRDGCCHRCSRLTRPPCTLACIAAAHASDVAITAASLHCSSSQCRQHSQVACVARSTMRSFRRRGLVSTVSSTPLQRMATLGPSDSVSCLRHSCHPVAPFSSAVASASSPQPPPSASRSLPLFDYSAHLRQPYRPRSSLLHPLPAPEWWRWGHATGCRTSACRCPLR